MPFFGNIETEALTMKIRVTNHPITMMGLKVPSNRAYVNENDFKVVFNDIHNFDTFAVVTGVYYNADAGKDGAWAKCRLYNYGTFMYLVSGKMIKAHFRISREDINKIMDKVETCATKPHEKAVSPKLDDFRANREIIKSGCAPLEKRANNTFLPDSRTYYELRKANADNADFGTAIGTDTPCWNETGKTSAVVKPPKKRDYKEEKLTIIGKNNNEVKVDTSQNPATLPKQPGPDHDMTPEEFFRKFGITPEQFARG